MTLAQLRLTTSASAAQARRERFMRGDRLEAAKWAWISRLWLDVLRLRIAEAADDLD